ncbi:MAG: HAD hydrolase-like protein [Fervidicoccaceae archaeon]
MSEWIAILDYDMTIVDSLKIFYRVYNDLLRKYFGEEVSIDEFREMFCKNTIDEYKTYPPSFWEEFKQLYRAMHPSEISPMPGLGNFLKVLEKLGMEAYIITGRGVEPQDIERELRFLNIEKFSGKIRTLKGSGGEHPFDKTEEVRKLLSEKKEYKCIMFGDYADDIIAAKKNGCLAVGITNGCKSPEYFKRMGADYVIKDLEEGAELVNRIVILPP